MTEWQPIHIHREAHKTLDVVKERTGYSKAEIIHRYCMVLNACLDVIERGYMIQIIPYKEREK